MRMAVDQRAEPRDARMMGEQIVEDRRSAAARADDEQRIGGADLRTFSCALERGTPRRQCGFSSSRWSDPYANRS